MSLDDGFRKVVLGLFAHPDDAEILCAGVLIKLKALGWEIHIATATAGDCGTVDKSPWEISAIRTAEAQAAAKMLGAAYHCLDERDGKVVFDKATLGKVIDLFRRVGPGLVLTHAPRDYMMDHEQVSMLARAASFVFGAPNVSQWPLLTGTRVPYVYFCDPIEARDWYGNVVEATTMIDISQEMEMKARLLGCHASQREWLRAHHGMDEYIEAMKRIGAERGKLIGAKYAEGFVQYRPHSYPQDDLLTALLGKK